MHSRITSKQLSPANTTPLWTMLSLLNLITIYISDDNVKALKLAKTVRQRTLDNIATLSVGLGGLGFLSMNSRFIRMFTTTMATTICSFKLGYQLQCSKTYKDLWLSIDIMSPNNLTNTVNGWKQSSLLIFQKYRSLTTQYIEGYTINNHVRTVTLDSYTLQEPLQSATKHIQKDITITCLKNVCPSFSNPNNNTFNLC